MYEVPEKYIDNTCFTQVVMLKLHLTRKGSFLSGQNRVLEWLLYLVHAENSHLDPLAEKLLVCVKVVGYGLHPCMQTVG